MYGLDIIKKRMMLAFEVSKLYVKTGFSASELSSITDISVGAIKRYTNMIERKRDEYLKHFPELMTEQEIDLFIEYINKRHKINKKTSKWNKGESDSSLNQIAADVNKIRQLHAELDLSISPQKRRKMTSMREQGHTYREIAHVNGTSLSQTYVIAKEGDSQLDQMLDNPSLPPTDKIQKIKK